MQADKHSQGTATCGALKWPTSLPNGAALFSLRPECIRPATAASATGSPENHATVRFRAKLRDQAFHGATELLRVESEGGLILTIRTASRDLPNSEAPLEFEFSAADAIPVRLDCACGRNPGMPIPPDRRPQILYERHIFHRLTRGQYDDRNISDPLPGGYGARGAHQYDRLAIAVGKDRTAALESASWGIGQVMGMNYALAGFQSVDDMVTAMSESEDKQLAAMSAFLVSTKLNGSLQAHDWTSFARGYNGPSYAINRYNVRLNGEFQKYSAGVLPDLNVRAAQLYLIYLGFDPGTIDGIAGRHTLSALAQFQKQAGLPVTAAVDEATVAQLKAALPPVKGIASAA